MFIYNIYILIERLLHLILFSCKLQRIQGIYQVRDSLDRSSRTHWCDANDAAVKFARSEKATAIV